MEKKMMTRYTKVLFWAILIGLSNLPCYVWAATSITETSAAFGEGCAPSGQNSIAMGADTHATNGASIAMGAHNIAAVSYSTVIGRGFDVANKLLNLVPSSFMVGYMASETDTEPEFFVKDGAVGFGTKTPTEQITITTPSNTDTKILFTETTSPAVSLFYEGSAGAGTNNLFHIRSEISGSEKNIMTWKLNGYVGIGKSAPGEKLDIADGNGRVESGYSWLTSSDSRLKKNVSTLEGALEKISHLRGVRFDIKKDESINMGDGKHIGVIAQELEKEYPELVVGDEKTGYKAVAYDKLTAVLIEAVKELKSQNERQKAEIEKLRSMIMELKS